MWEYKQSLSDEIKKTVFALLHTLTQGILFTLTFLHSLMLRMAE